MKWTVDDYGRHKTRLGQLIEAQIPNWRDLNMCSITTVRGHIVEYEHFYTNPDGHIVSPLLVSRVDLS